MDIFSGIGSRLMSTKWHSIKGLKDLSPAYMYLLFYLYFYSTKFVYLLNQTLPYRDPLLYSSKYMISMVGHIFPFRVRTYWLSYIVDIYETTFFLNKFFMVQYNIRNIINNSYNICLHFI